MKKKAKNDATVKSEQPKQVRPRRLVLSRETLRELGSEMLRGAAGGQKPATKATFCWGCGSDVCDTTGP